MMEEFVESSLDSRKRGTSKEYFFLKKLFAFNLSQEILKGKLFPKKKLHHKVLNLTKQNLIT